MAGDTTTAGNREPAQADSQAANPQRDAGQGTVADSQPQDAKLQEMLAANRKLQERYEHAQQLIQRQGEELGRYRKSAPAASTEQSAEVDPVASRINASDQRLDLIQYRQETPDWTKFQPDIDEIVNDQVRIYEVVAWKPDGFGNTVVDWYRTYKNAKNQVELQQYRSAQEKAAQQQQATDEQRNALKGMSTLSGVSASPGDKEITINDIRGKSAAEIAEIARQAGLVPQHDPLRR